MKENLKPCVYKQRERGIKRDFVLFVERTGELQLHDVDPKPGDLSMGRLKWW